MIKNYRKYLKEQKKEREKHLQSLTYVESAKMVNGLQDGLIWFKKNFSADDDPLCLQKYIEKLKCHKK